MENGKYDLGLKHYSYKGFMFFCLPGLGIGYLLGGDYPLGVLLIFGLAAYFISKDFWERVIRVKEYRFILYNLLGSNICAVAAGYGILIMYLPLLMYGFYFGRNEIYRKVKIPK